MLLVAYLRREMSAGARSSNGARPARADDPRSESRRHTDGRSRRRGQARRPRAGRRHGALPAPLADLGPVGDHPPRSGALLPPDRPPRAGDHRRYAMQLLATVIPSQRWGVGRVPQHGWSLYFKGGWGSGTGLVDHQVALYRAGGERFSLALFTRSTRTTSTGRRRCAALPLACSAACPHPGGRLPRAGRAALERSALVTARTPTAPRDDPPA